MVIREMVAFGEWSHFSYSKDWSFGDWSFGEWLFRDWSFGEWSFGEWSFGEWSFGEWSFGEWTVYREKINQFEGFLEGAKQDFFMSEL
jgi:hypothetical protein